MSKKNKHKQQPLEPGAEYQQHHLEILKAVAQAWHARSTSSRSTADEHDAYRQTFQTKPSRFKLEAINKQNPSISSSTDSSGKWDFQQSLLDSYEIVTVVKKLERALVLDDPFSGLDNQIQSRVQRKPKESKNSLRNLFSRLSSRRFNEADIHIPRRQDI